MKIAERTAVWRGERRVLLRVSRAAWRLEQAGRERIWALASARAALDITGAANALAGEGFPVDTDDLATVSPYITRTIRRFGSWVVDLTPPDRAPATRLGLELRVVFRV